MNFILRSNQEYSLYIQFRFNNSSLGMLRGLKWDTSLASKVIYKVRTIQWMNLKAHRVERRLLWNTTESDSEFTQVVPIFPEI
jgi:hypothetical protein